VTLYTTCLYNSDFHPDSSCSELGGSWSRQSSAVKLSFYPFLRSRVWSFPSNNNLMSYNITLFQLLAFCLLVDACLLLYHKNYRRERKQVISNHCLMTHRITVKSIDINVIAAHFSKTNIKLYVIILKQESATCT